MRIGIFNPYFDGMEGGERYILTLAKCLSQNARVEIFWDDAGVLPLAKDRFGFNLSSVKLTANIFSRNVSFLTRWRKSKEYDLIIFLSDGSLPFVSPKRLFVHFQFPIEWVNAQNFRFRFKLSRVDKIFCNSNFTKGFIDKKLKVKSSVLYPPAELPTDSFVPHKKENMILTVGRFSELENGSTFKKHEVLINAFKTMIDNGVKNWEFIVVTSYRMKDGQAVNRLRTLTKGYPIEVVGNPSHKQLLELYRKAKVYWHASGFGEDISTHPEYAEHFGIVTVEAMGYRCVPVVIRAGGHIETVDDNENGFLWDNIEELIEDSKRVMFDSKLYEAMAEKAFKKAQDFRTEVFCEKALTLLT